jgi:hypothetical protein
LHLLWFYAGLIRGLILQIESGVALNDAGTTVFVGSNNGHVYAFDAETGVERWRFLAQNLVGHPTQSYSSVGWTSHSECCAAGIILPTGCKQAGVQR